MAAEMHLVITLRKPVPDRETGLQLFELVKTRLADHPDVTITGHVTNHFALDQEPDS